MPAERCSICGVSWPTSYNECPGCGGETSYFSDTDPSPDWKDRLDNSMLVAMPTKTEQDIEQMRLERFQAGGLALDKAMILAADQRINLHRYEGMIRAGCDPDLAYEILA